ncbi:MAG: amino acid ABC transporter substrate-binding protein, partial [Alphaproteobacteria bacterium]|nr:amino acid ABC transporter substrate-binding protein [Alphaproteobacteria bacterium]
MKLKTTLVAATAAVAVSAAAQGATLDDVKAKGFIQCGVSTGLAGSAGPPSGIEIPWPGIFRG